MEEDNADQEHDPHDEPATQLRSSDGRSFLVHSRAFVGDDSLRLVMENVNLTGLGIST
jgi:hypothetical protein